MTIYCEGEAQQPGKEEESTFKHPRVFLTWGENLEVSCPYCGRVFKKEEEKTSGE